MFYNQRRIIMMNKNKKSHKTHSKQSQKSEISIYSQETFELPSDYNLVLKIGSLGETNADGLRKLLKELLIIFVETGPARFDPEVDTSEIESLLGTAINGIKDRLMFLYLDGRCEDLKFQNLSKIIEDFEERIWDIDISDDDDDNDVEDLNEFFKENKTH